MTHDIEHRYAQVLQYAQAAEVEIKKLRVALAEQKEATQSMTIIAESALEALESIGKGYQA